MRVEASKKTFMTVFPRRVAAFLLLSRERENAPSARSRTSTMSAAESSSIPSKWRCVHMGDRITTLCHPEERSDEGTPGNERSSGSVTPVVGTLGEQRALPGGSFASLRMTQRAQTRANAR